MAAESLELQPEGPSLSLQVFLYHDRPYLKLTPVPGNICIFDHHPDDVMTSLQVSFNKLSDEEQEKIKSQKIDLLAQFTTIQALFLACVNWQEPTARQVKIAHGLKSVEKFIYDL